MDKEEFKIGEIKSEAFNSVEEYLSLHKYKIVSSALDKPWGGFYVLDENDAERFAKYFFSDDASAMLSVKNKLSPKILVVAPGQRLSWQYHHRRAEIWKLIAGSAGVIISDSNEEKDLKEIAMGEIVRLKVGERHRLVGLKSNWGAVAEIWQHIDPSNPSDENDIVRLQDDYNRA